MSLIDPAVGAARVADPLGHFPYKHERARMGTHGDEDHLMEVDATAAYVAAQEAYLLNPSEETRAAERAAAADLQAVRRERRLTRDQAAREALAEQAEEV